MQVPYSAAIMAHERMDFYAIVSIFDALCKLGVVVAIPYISLDRLIFYGTFIALVSLIDLVCYYIYVRRNFKDLFLISVVEKSFSTNV